MSAPARTRLVRIELEGNASAAEGALLVRGDAHPFALAGDWAGGGAIVGSEPVAIAGPDDDPFELLDVQPEVAAGGEGVGGGWFGYLGYNLGARLEPVPPPPPRQVPLPDFALAFYDHVLRLDSDGRWWFEALWTDERADALNARLDVLRTRLAEGVRERPVWVGTFRPAPPGGAGHLAAIDECRERIAAGEIFQANLCLRLEAEWKGDPLDLFARAAGTLEPRHAGVVAGPWGAVCSLSPELFLRRRGREVITEPIKGTAPRVLAAGREAARGAGRVASRVHGEGHPARERRRRRPPARQLPARIGHGRPEDPGDARDRGAGGRRARGIHRRRRLREPRRRTGAERRDPDARAARRADLDGRGRRGRGGFGRGERAGGVLREGAPGRRRRGRAYRGGAAGEPGRAGAGARGRRGPTEPGSGSVRDDHRARRCCGGCPCAPGPPRAQRALVVRRGASGGPARTGGCRSRCVTAAAAARGGDRSRVHRHRRATRDGAGTGAGHSGARGTARRPRRAQVARPAAGRRAGGSTGCGSAPRGPPRPRPGGRLRQRPPRRGRAPHHAAARRSPATRDRPGARARASSRARGADHARPRG